ncbi:MAG: DUF1273 domain-containing protein [Oscillospiraceae bacterium]|nr:DUF1273 domain-containing protein [Oscillospiraceae bacterium]
MAIEFELSERAATCCFSGYRPEKLPWGRDDRDARARGLWRRLYDVTDALYASGIRHFLCGMARGADTYFCEAVLALRELRKNITLEAALPCEGQASRWAEPDRKRYFALVARCDRQTMVSRLYTPDCMRRRNRYMVDNSSVIVTVFDGKSGGTAYTRQYAARRGLEIIDIKP